jgi:glycosyltransferase involved in cell wall biosynthesis
LTETSTTSPRVSVIIPCYNGERFIGGAVESVLGQTFDDFEIVVVDDGSSDGSRAAVERYMGDPRVRYETHESNLGIPAARNTGLRCSRAEYVAFLDQDDLWTPEKLERQVHILDVSPASVGFTFSDVLIVDDMGRSLGLSQGRWIPRSIEGMSRDDRLRALFLHDFIPLISVVVRRACLDECGWFNERIRSGMDDYELCLRLIAGCDVRVIREPLATHRTHGLNYSADTERLVSDAPEIIEMALEEHPFLSRLMPRKMAIHHVRLARYHRDLGDPRSSRAEIRRSIECDRTWVRPYAMYALSLTGGLGRFLLRMNRSFRRMGS